MRQAVKSESRIEGIRPYALAFLRRSAHRFFIIPGMLPVEKKRGDRVGPPLWGTKFLDALLGKRLRTGCLDCINSESGEKFQNLKLETGRDSRGTNWGDVFETHHRISLEK
jgi:hypothetical protein